MASQIETPALITIEDESSGLRAYLAVDSLVSGRAAGGVRTKRYESNVLAKEDALRLASAMSEKCQAAKLPCGGCKIVIDASHLKDRKAAFVALGKALQQYQGLVNTAGDLGTTSQDLENLASVCDYVSTDELDLADATATTVEIGIMACIKELGKPVSSISVAVQGLGSMGLAVTRRLAKLPISSLYVSDLNLDLAQDVAEEISQERSIPTTAVEPNKFYEIEADIWSPCATGGVITKSVVKSCYFKAICGAANNQLASAEVLELLRSRNILYIPDYIASSGAVIKGISEGVLGELDSKQRIDSMREICSKSLSN